MDRVKKQTNKQDTREENWRYVQQKSNKMDQIVSKSLKIAFRCRKTLERELPRSEQHILLRITEILSSQIVEKKTPPKTEVQVRAVCVCVCVYFAKLQPPQETPTVSKSGSQRHNWRTFTTKFTILFDFPTFDEGAMPLLVLTIRILGDRTAHSGRDSSD